MLIEKIGLGGMGFVYKANHRFLGNNVAIKILKPKSGTGYSQAQNRFLREAQIMAKLEHQNIVKITDFDSNSLYAYFVMEFLNGKTLEEKLSESKTLSLNEASHILTEVCEAVTYAHENGVLHRDLKPANIFMAITKDGEKLKVLDFGIAKILDSEETQITKSNTIIGTLRYMSPEQISNEKDIDFRADIYSLGVILYQMLCGKVPFEAENIAQLCAMQLTGNLKSISEMGRDVSLEIERIIQKALANERKRRQLSAVELADEFKTAVLKQNSGMSETIKMEDKSDRKESVSPRDEENEQKATYFIKNKFEDKVIVKGDFNA